MEDDLYRGMLIPKGSLDIPNIKYVDLHYWQFCAANIYSHRGMSLDESVYSDATSFYPERFLPKPAGNEEPYFDNIVFCFGRRFVLCC